jgi:hypothetical protein
LLRFLSALLASIALCEFGVVAIASTAAGIALSTKDQIKIDLEDRSAQRIKSAVSAKQR